MPVKLSHLQLNVGNFSKSAKFYKSLAKYFGWKILFDTSEYLTINLGGVDAWIMPTGLKYRSRGYHRKGTGVNHLSFRVGSVKEVDRFHREFLEKNKVSVLYGGPKKYLEYTPKYYAVYFEDPDRMKLEVAYF